MCKGMDKHWGLYIHIPFCTLKCPYCDFYTCSKDSESATEYAQALCTEIDLAHAFGWSPKNPLNSIFLGGGTPSLFPLSCLEQVFSKIHACLNLTSHAEITMEMNPEDITLEKASAWKDFGINRASLGLQALSKPELACLERKYSSLQAREAFDCLRQAGFGNINVDLMYGLENQTRQSWANTLKEVSLWQPEHISAYLLTIKDNTSFGKKLQNGLLKLPQDQVVAQLFLDTHEFLPSEGLLAYEISNFSRKNFESQHNVSYWTGLNYWGIGVSAHSFQKNSSGFYRFWNPRNYNQYIDPLACRKIPTKASEHLSEETHWRERLMTGLRMRKGINLKEIQREFNTSPPPEIFSILNSYLDSGHLLYKDHYYSLTPKGMLFSNDVFQDLF